MTLMILTLASVILLPQELEPGIYSIRFGDPRLLEGRIQDAMERYTACAPLMKRLVEYQHPEHLRGTSSNDKEQGEVDRLESACEQVG